MYSLVYAAIVIRTAAALTPLSYILMTTITTLVALDIKERDRGSSNSNNSNNVNLFIRDLVHIS